MNKEPEYITAQKNGWQEVVDAFLARTCMDDDSSMIIDDETIGMNCHPDVLGQVLHIELNYRKFCDEPEAVAWLLSFKARIGGKAKPVVILANDSTTLADYIATAIGGRAHIINVPLPFIQFRRDTIELITHVARNLDALMVLIRTLDEDDVFRKTLMERYVELILFALLVNCSFIVKNESKPRIFDIPSRKEIERAIESNKSHKLFVGT